IIWRSTFSRESWASATKALVVAMSLTSKSSSAPILWAGRVKRLMSLSVMMDSTTPAFITGSWLTFISSSNFFASERWASMAMVFGDGVITSANLISLGMVFPQFVLSLWLINVGVVMV